MASIVSGVIPIEDRTTDINCVDKGPPVEFLQHALWELGVDSGIGGDKGIAQ